MTTEKIKAAEAKIKACGAAIVAIDAQRVVAVAKLASANDDWRAACLERDSTLPKAQIKTFGRHCSKPRFDDVVIVKNTGKTITVRPAGSRHDGDQYRLAKDGRWWLYPKPDSWSVGRELIIDGSAS